MTPLLGRRKHMSSLGSFSHFLFTPGCEALELTLYTKLCYIKVVLWSSTTRLCFSTKSLDHLHLSMPHWQFTPCNWCLSIYNLWARTSQRMVLSKRINYPPPNRYIFSRDQWIQHKGIKHQTYHPFTSLFWVWTKPEAPYSSSRMSNTGERPLYIRKTQNHLPLKWNLHGNHNSV